MASDIIQILLDEINSKTITVFQGIVDILLEICKYFSLNQTFKDEALEEESYLDKLFMAIQMRWSQIFGQISKISYEKCMKVFMNSLVQDYRKLKDDEIDKHAQKIYFCRFISISPSDKLMASNIQTLLDSIYNLLCTKKISHEIKRVVLVTLKYIIE